MTQHGVHVNRNARHKEYWPRRYAAAVDDRARLAVAYDWLRSSAALLGRRRTPEGIDQEVHRAVAARLMREAAGHLKTLAGAIDRGEYDTGKG